MRYHGRHLPTWLHVGNMAVIDGALTLDATNITEATRTGRAAQIFAA